MSSERSKGGCLAAPTAKKGSAGAWFGFRVGRESSSEEVREGNSRHFVFEACDPECMAPKAKIKAARTRGSLVRASESESGWTVRVSGLVVRGGGCLVSAPPYPLTGPI